MNSLQLSSHCRLLALAVWPDMHLHVSPLPTSQKEFVTALEHSADAVQLDPISAKRTHYIS